MAHLLHYGCHYNFKSEAKQFKVKNMNIGLLLFLNLFPCRKVIILQWKDKIPIASCKIYDDTDTYDDDDDDDDDDYYDNKSSVMMTRGPMMMFFYIYRCFSHLASFSHLAVPQAFSSSSIIMIDVKKYKNHSNNITLMNDIILNALVNEWVITFLFNVGYSAIQNISHRVILRLEYKIFIIWDIQCTSWRYTS